MQTACRCIRLLYAHVYAAIGHAYVLAGFEKPSAIQQRAIMPILSGRDVIAQAQSGTGKTATIGMVTLETIDTLVREPQACRRTVHY